MPYAKDMTVEHENLRELTHKPRLGIIGFGVVGEAIAYGFSDHDVCFYDKFKPSLSMEQVCADSDIIFVSLPTPYKGNRIDLGIIETNVAELVQHTNNTGKLVVIKSTVIPGTTRRLAAQYPDTNFAFSPEFLTEANYLEDFANADRHVVGADDIKTSLQLTALFKNQWPKTPVIQTDPTTAELGKYAANSFLALKVMFANEMSALCESLGIEWSEAKRIVVSDNRIGNTHLDVTSNKGFSGKCFPKDMVALLGVFEEANVDSSILTAAWEKNLRIRKVRDWDDIPFVRTDEDEAGDT